MLSISQLLAQLNFNLAVMQPPPATGTDPTSPDNGKTDVITKGTTEFTTGVQTWIQTGREFLIEQAPAFIANVILAIVIFILGRWIAQIISSLTKRMMRHAKIEDTLIEFLSNLGYWVMMLIVIMASLDRLGINTTSFAAIIAAAGLAIGLSLQNTLSNFANGVMIILFHPFRVGDFIEAGGVKGTVEAIRIFVTTLRTPDNIEIIIPNSSVNSGTITNFSAKPYRRIDLEIGCGYHDNLLAVKEFFEEVLAADERVLDDPAPFIAVGNLGDSCVTFLVRPWVRNSDYFTVKCELTEAIKIGFDERGFSFPYPSRDVYVHNQPSK